MMRNIRLRAWDKEIKKFGYLNILPNTINWMSPQYSMQKPVRDHYGDLSGISFANIDGWEEFTGLYDLKGTEIFEGDIVKSNEWTVFLRDYKRDDGTILIKVEWCRTKWVGTIISEKGRSYELGEFVNDRAKLPNSGEVIGNIHEHKHLLDKN
jgi:uncharacterized phage protein (TIGR01671 family)